MPRCVLITGASGGIGAAMAETFAAAGDRVALHWHAHPQKAQELCVSLKQKGYEVLDIGADVANREQVDAMFDEVEKNFGAVNVLVNNAGIAQQKMFCDITENEWDRMFDVHVKGAFNCSQRALSNMVRSKSGCIINISSMWGQVGASCEVHYSAAKAAVIGMTKALAKELGPSGVRVNCIAPGVVDTAMMKGFSREEKAELSDEIPLGRFALPSEIADLAVFLSSDNAGYITGQVLAPNGGFVV